MDTIFQTSKYEKSSSETRRMVKKKNQNVCVERLEESKNQIYKLSKTRYNKISSLAMGKYTQILLENSQKPSIKQSSKQQKNSWKGLYIPSQLLQ